MRPAASAAGTAQHDRKVLEACARRGIEIERRGLTARAVLQSAQEMPAGARADEAHLQRQQAAS